MRFYYLDNLRGLLMILGVVLHTCAAFSPNSYWLVHSQYSLGWVDSLNGFIHIFRMPLFFMISGFFAVLVLQKRSRRKFCTDKLMRIAIPFLVVIVSVNIPQYLLLSSLDEGPNVRATSSITGHLWFLINLLFYFFIFVLLHDVIKALLRLIQLKSSFLSFSLLLIISPFIYVFILALNKIGVPIYVELPLLGSLYQLFAYIDYFFIGVLFFYLSHDTLIGLLRSLKGLLLTAALLLFSMFHWWENTAYEVIMRPYSEHLLALILSCWLWLAGSIILKSKARLLNLIVDSSYTIYLFHHVLVVLFILGLNRLYNYIDLSPVVAFFAIIIITVILTVAFHTFVIAKSRILRLLFNGKTK